MGQSTNHHWWPKGLQKGHWQDENKRVHWMKPDGSHERKNPAIKNNPSGSSLRGHKLELTHWDGTPWEGVKREGAKPDKRVFYNAHTDTFEETLNFENDFEDIDNAVHRIIGTAQDIARQAPPLPPRFPLAHSPPRPTPHHDLSQVNWMQRDQAELNQLMLFCLSLLIRSPASRSRLSRTPRLMNLPENERLGKSQLRARLQMVRSRLKDGAPRILLPTILYTPGDTASFLYGDGLPDCLTGHLDTACSLLKGHALVPLTPDICVFLWNPSQWNNLRNCAAIRVGANVVQRINLLTEIYAKDMLFFKGTPPRLSCIFRRGEHGHLKHGTDRLFTTLKAALSSPHP